MKKRLTGCLTILGLLMGLCCLFITATTFSEPGWMPRGLLNAVLTWGPLVCITGVVITGVTLTVPDLVQTLSARRFAMIGALMVLGIGIAIVMLFRGCLLAKP